MGTLRYCAPEILRGEKYGVSADIYSFGMVLYELLMRRAPFEGQSTTDLLRRIAHKHERPSFEALDPECGWAAELAARCWAAAPADRPPVADVVAALTARVDRVRTAPLNRQASGGRLSGQAQTAAGLARQASGGALVRQASSGGVLLARTGTAQRLGALLRQASGGVLARTGTVGALLRQASASASSSASSGPGGAVAAGKDTRRGAGAGAASSGS